MTHSETVSGLRLTMRFFASMFVALILFPPISYGQSVTTGLGRLYIEPLGSNLVTLLTAEIVQQRLPITMTRSEDESDCVMLWIPLGESPPSKPATKPVSKASPGKTKVEGNMAIFDRQEKSIVWELSLTTAKFDSLSLAEQKKLASKIVRGMSQRGAYCGGAPFSAATQNAADRTKAFKPPFFNW
jgi:hypothetical protein